MSNASSSTTWKVWVSLSVAMMGFAGYGVVIRQFGVKNNVDPLFFCLLRDIGAFPVLALSAVAREGRLNLIKVSEIPLFFSLGFLGMFGNQYCFIMGVYYAGVATVALLSPAIPVFTSILAISCRIERCPSLSTQHGCMKIFGIGSAVMGSLMILLSKHNVGDSGDLAGATVTVGVMFAIGSTFCGSAYFVVQKKFIFESNSYWSQLPISVTAWSYFFGALCMAVPSLYSLISCLLLSATCDGNSRHLSYHVIGLLVYAIFITSALCYQLLSWANKHASPILVAMFYLVQTPIAMLLAYVFLNEQADLKDAVGGAFIMLGVLLVIFSDWHEKNSSKHVGSPGSHKQKLSNCDQ